MSKKVFAVLTAVIILCASLCGCLTQPDTRTVYTINGREFVAGEYLMYQLNSYELISSYMSATFGRTDSSTGTFYDMQTQMQWTVSPPYGDGETVEIWLAVNTLDAMKLAVYFENAMKEYGLTVTDEDRKEAEELSDYLYSNGEKEYDQYYTRNGIGLASVKKWLSARYNQNAVFKYLYDVGGEREVAQSELMERFLYNYGYYKIIQIPYYDLTTGKAYSDEELAAIELYISDSVAAINRGELTIDQMQQQLLAADGELTEEESKVVAGSEFVEFASSIYTSNFIDTYRSLNYGQAGYDKDDNYGFYFVFLKMDPTAEGLTYFEDNRSAVLSDLKGTEYLEQCLELTDDYTVEYDQSVIEFYNPVKIKPELTESN